MMDYRRPVRPFRLERDVRKLCTATTFVTMAPMRQLGRLILVLPMFSRAKSTTYPDNLRCLRLDARVGEEKVSYLLGITQSISAKSRACQLTSVDMYIIFPISAYDLMDFLPKGQSWLVVRASILWVW
jgi:hypothetical protein